MCSISNRQVWKCSCMYYIENMTIGFHCFHVINTYRSQILSSKLSRESGRGYVDPCQGMNYMRSFSSLCQDDKVMTSLIIALSITWFQLYRLLSIRHTKSECAWYSDRIQIWCTSVQIGSSFNNVSTKICKATDFKGLFYWQPILICSIALIMVIGAAFRAQRGGSVHTACEVLRSNDITTIYRVDMVENSVPAHSRWGCCEQLACTIPMPALR